MADKKVVNLNKFRNKKLLKKIFYILRIPLVILVVIAALFLSARLLGNVATSNITDAIRQTGDIFKKGEGYPYTAGFSSFGKVTNIGASPLVLYDDLSVVLNSSASEIFNMQVSYADAKVTTKNGRALIYSTSSNEVTLQSKTEKLGTVTEEGTVVTAALSKNGYIATASKSDENQCVLSVYNNRFRKVFQWNCSQERISDISLSSSGKRLAVTAVGATNAEIYTRLLVFDVDETEPVVDNKYSGTLLLRVIYTNSNKIIAAGDNRTVVINTKGEPVDELVYSEDSLLAVCDDDNGNTVIFYEEFGGAKTGMVRYSSGGKKTCTVTFDGIPECVTANGGKIAVADADKITLYSSNGKETRTIETEHAASKIFCCSGEIYTVENDKICKY